MDPVTGWLLVAGLNAAMASQKASQQARQRKAEADIRAAEIEASPWTGRAPSTQVSTARPSMWAELAGAGVNALGQASALEKSGLFTEAEDLPGKELPGGDVPGGSTLMPSAQVALEKKAAQEALQENSSFAYPWESKRSTWLSALSRK